MKNKLIKLLSLSLAILMLSVAFVSCKKEEAPVETGTVSTTEAETETDIYEGLRDKNYNGKKFTILTYDTGVGWNPYLLTVEEGAQVLNDAVINRNNEVAELLNMQIATMLVPQNEIVSTVEKTNFDGEVTYDLVLSYATNTFASLMSGGHLYNVKKVENMKLDKPWYNQNANQNFTLKQKQYFFVSDLSLPVQQRFAFLANLDMINEDPDVLGQFNVSSFYELVNKGEWTIDNMELMIKNVNPDNSNSSLDGTYGFATNINSLSRFLNNWGEDIVKRDQYGRFQYTLNVNHGMIEQKVSRLTSLIHDNNDVYIDELNNQSANSYYDIFKAGRAMFSTYSSDPWSLKDQAYQDGKFAYIPYPKYTGQENYITVTHGGLMMFALNTPDISFSGAVTEALSAASFKYMVDAYKKNYFQAKIIQDPEGVDMYQIILDTAYYDIARYVDPSKGALCVALGYFWDPILKDSALSTQYKNKGSAITTAYEDFMLKLPNE